MRSIYRIKTLFRFAVVCLFMMSVSVLFMPITVNYDGSDRFLKVLVGLMFWASAVLGYVLIIIANKKRKDYIISKLDGNVKMDCRPGITTFFSNVPAMVFDIVMIIALMLFIVINFTEWKNAFIAYVLLFLLIFSMNMHCLFNGRIYKITKRRTRREKNYGKPEK